MFKGPTIEHFPLGITSHWDQSGINPEPIHIYNDNNIYNNMIYIVIIIYIN